MCLDALQSTPQLFSTGTIESIFSKSARTRRTWPKSYLSRDRWAVSHEVFCGTNSDMPSVIWGCGHARGGRFYTALLLGLRPFRHLPPFCWFDDRCRLWNLLVKWGEYKHILHWSRNAMQHWRLNPSGLLPICAVIVPRVSIGTNCEALCTFNKRVWFPYDNCTQFTSIFGATGAHAQVAEAAGRLWMIEGEISHGLLILRASRKQAQWMASHAYPAIRSLYRHAPLLLLQEVRRRSPF